MRGERRLMHIGCGPMLPSAGANAMLAMFFDS